MPAPRRLLRLIYASQSTETAVAVDESVRSILVRSISNNRLVDVTGLLLVHAGWFLQVLEGPEASVHQTFERISRDPRHNGIVVLAETGADARLFKDWNMCERRITLAEAGLLRQLGQADTFAPARLTEDDALTLLSSVGRSHAA